MLEAALVVGLLGLLVYGTIMVLTRPQAQRPPAPLAGSWRVAHYDAHGATRVVLQRSTAAAVLDEHVVATIRCDDPEYEVKFMDAMATARERLALFEAEE